MGTFWLTALINLYHGGQTCMCCTSRICGCRCGPSFLSCLLSIHSQNICGADGFPTVEPEQDFECPEGGYFFYTHDSFFHCDVNGVAVLKCCPKGAIHAIDCYAPYFHLHGFRGYPIHRHGGLCDINTVG